MPMLSPCGRRFSAGRRPISHRSRLAGFPRRWAGIALLGLLAAVRPGELPAWAESTPSEPVQDVLVEELPEPVELAAPEAAPAPQVEEVTAAPQPGMDGVRDELGALRSENVALQVQVQELERALAATQDSVATLRAKLDAVLSVPQPEDTDMVRVYRVREGDTLYMIAQRPEIYSDGRLWRRILEANRHTLTDPQKLQPGQQLIIPR